MCIHCLEQEDKRMILEDTRNDFMQSIYDMFSDDETNDRANQIIDIFDIATENCIELPCKVGDKCITNEGIVCHINTITLSNDEDLLLYLSPDNKDPITIVKLLSEVTLISKESAEQALREREIK